LHKYFFGSKNHFDYRLKKMENVVKLRCKNPISVTSRDNTIAIQHEASFVGADDDDGDGVLVVAVASVVDDDGPLVGCVATCLEDTLVEEISDRQ